MEAALSEQKGEQKSEATPVLADRSKSNRSTGYAESWHVMENVTVTKCATSVWNKNAFGTQPEMKDDSVLVRILQQARTDRSETAVRKKMHLELSQGCSLA